MAEYDEYDDDDDEAATLSAPGLAGSLQMLSQLGTSYTTPEARAIAHRTFQELYDERKRGYEGEAEGMEAINRSAQEARAALQQARKELQERRFGKAELYLSMASAFGSPTKTGGFGETLGNVAGSMMEPLQRQRKWGEARDQQLLDYQLLSGNIDRDLAKYQVEIAKARRAADARLMSEALRVMGREVRPGSAAAASMSKYGKIARDEGFEPGTPEHMERVTELYTHDLAAQKAQAGIDAPGTDPEEGRRLAYDAGVPANIPDPYRGMSTKAATARRNIDFRAAQETIDGLSAAEVESKKGIADADRFVFLAKRNMDSLGTFRGQAPPITAAEQEMDAITARIARKVREPGEGSTSNYDAQQFRLGSVARTKDYSTNRNMAMAFKTFEQNQLDKIAFMNNFADVHGHLHGAERAWREYLGDNPIFDPRRPGELILNKDRVNFNIYFREQIGALPAYGEEEDAGYTLEDLKRPVPGPIPGATGEVEVDEEQSYAEGGRVRELRALLESLGSYAEGGKVSNVISMIDALEKVGKKRVRGEYKSATPAPVSNIEHAKPHLVDEGGNPVEVGSVVTSERDGVIERYEVTGFQTPRHENSSGRVYVKSLDKGYDAQYFPHVFGLTIWRPPVKKAEGGSVTDEQVRDMDDDGDIDEEDIKMFLAALAQGSTLGFADEPLPEDDQQAMISLAAKYRQEHPVASRVTQAAGAAIPAALLTMTPGLREARTLLGPAIGMGGTFGAVSAMGGGATDEGKQTESVIRGAAGVPAGILAGFGTKWMYNKAGQVVDTITGRPLSPGEIELLGSMEDDLTGLDEIAQRLRDSQKRRVPTTLVDEMGRQGQATVERAATAGGQPAEQFLENLTQRQAGARERVSEQINRGLVPDEYFGKMDELTEQLYTNAKPLYAVAYEATPKVSSLKIMELLGTPLGKRASVQAMELMRNEGELAGKPDVSGMVRSPSLKYLDYVKRAMDDAINREETDGPTNRGRGMRNVRNTLRDELDNVSDEYKAARAQYAGDLEVRDALRHGREKWSKMAPEEVRRAVKDMSFSEKDAFRSGAAQYLFQQIDNPSSNINPARRIVGSPAMVARLETLFDSPKKFEVFKVALEQEARIFDQSKASAGRIAGTRLTEMKKGDSLLSILDPGMSNVPGMGGISWLNRFYNWIRFAPQMSEKTANQILEILNEKDSKKVQAQLAKLADAQQRLKVRRRRSGKAGMIAAGIAGALMQPMSQIPEEEVQESMTDEEIEAAIHEAQRRREVEGRLREKFQGYADAEQE